MSNTDPSNMRAGTSDRDACARVINEALVEGRISADEHDQRLSACYAAVTMGDLAKITADLPPLPPTGAAQIGQTAVPVVAAPVATVGASEAKPEPGSRAAIKATWWSWLGVAVMMTVIWALSSYPWDDGVDGYWPVWVIVPWGAVNLLATFRMWGNGK